MWLAFDWAGWAPGRRHVVLVSSSLLSVSGSACQNFPVPLIYRRTLRQSDANRDLIQELLTFVKYTEY